MLRRRQLLLASAAGVAAAAGSAALAGCAPRPTVPTDGVFTHAVASGDPHPTSVVLWTRVNPARLPGPVEVAWWAEPIGGGPRATGTATTGAGRDGTVKVVAGGLRPGTRYRYGFTVDGVASPEGRTRTAPVGATDLARFGVVSCSNYAFGNFHAYRHLAARDLDAVVHLGDYLYEYANPGFGETYGEYRRLVPDHEILTLADYRARYGLYRSDPDLQELHRLHPMFHVWDDHEFADDPFIGGAANHQPQDGSWAARVAGALQAYDEWMPTRLAGDRIHRELVWGDLLTLVGVDRQRRFLFPAPDDGDLYLGREQFDWLDGRLAAARDRWVLLAQQTTFAATTADGAGGGWGVRDRGRVLDAVAAAGSDLVVLTGDIHRFHAIDAIRTPGTYDPATGAGSAAVDLACGSVTSDGSDGRPGGPQVRFQRGSQRGYLTVEVTPGAARAEFWGFPDVAKLLVDLPPEQRLAAFRVDRGAPFLVPA